MHIAFVSLGAFGHINPTLALVTELVKNGVDKSRLEAVGMGEADPIADNSTAEGRELNRRIMMKRIQ